MQNGRIRMLPFCCSIQIDKTCKPGSDIQLIGRSGHPMASALGCIDGVGRIGPNTANGICTTGKCHNSKDSGNWNNVG
jgi:hypothetical protein